MTNDPLIWERAREALPLPLLMTKLGDGQFTARKAPCPFCHDKTSWGIFEKDGRHFFKCHQINPLCPANKPDNGNTEIGYLALRKGWDGKTAAKEFLRMALPDEAAKMDERDRQKSESPEPEIPARDREDPRNVWHAIYKMFLLTQADFEKVTVQRGLSRETIATFGLRSNNERNKPLLESLPESFNMTKLIEEGIFIDDSHRERPRPSGQFYGYGIPPVRFDKHGKKIKDDGMRYTEPVIIPYYDDEGIPIYLRPHKGGVKKPKDELADIELFETEEEEQEAETCAAEVFVPPDLQDLLARSDGTCIFTEGEFKVMALWQCGIAAIGCPGITFIRNAAFRKKLLHVLKKFHIRDLVVVFDNEVKNDPKFIARYKPDPWDRYDTQMWAEYTVIDLHDYFVASKGTCRIGWIPDEHRVDGKADFDGVLATFVNKTNIERGTLSARRVFLDVIDSATEKNFQKELFPSEARRIIDQKLQRKFYVPLVKFGGDREYKLTLRFSEMASPMQAGTDPEEPEKKVTPGNPEPIDAFLAAKLRAVKGCYYKRAKVSPEMWQDLELKKAILEGHRDSLLKNKHENLRELRVVYSRLAAVWERQRGMPEPISNFTLSCEYKLHTIDNNTHLQVRLKSAIEGKNSSNRLILLTPDDTAQLSKFRKWCYNTGLAVWMGGDKELQFMMKDLLHHSYLRDIYQVDKYGHDKDTQLWLSGDTTFSDEGHEIHADESNIFWHEGVGYQVDMYENDLGRQFAQGAPLFTTPHPGAKKLENPDVLAIFDRMADDVFFSVGDFDGWIAIGIMLAYGIAPELLIAGGHPGLWIHGTMGEGKTTLARWLMRIWGYKHLEGIRIGSSTTPVGMQRLLAQYSCWPVWFEEFRGSLVDPEKLEVLRGSFDRSTGVKGLPDQTNRTRNARIFTTPIITGETSSSDAAVRSRFAHINLAQMRRIVLPGEDSDARYTRMQAESAHYYHIGRFIMQHRKHLADTVVEQLQKDWMNNPTVKKKIPQDRCRLVYGVAYLMFTAFCEVIKSRHSTQADKFYNSTLDFGENAMKDVISETFMSQFWGDVISAIRRPQSPVRRQFFEVRHVQRNEHGSLKICSADDKNAIQVVFFSPKAVYDSYVQDLRSRNLREKLDFGDIKRAMEKEPWFMPLPDRTHTKGQHLLRIDGSTTSCFVLNVTNTGTDEEPKYICPFAEELVHAIVIGSDASPEG